ncbi:MAG: antitoxin family protein [Chloroflexales bacterium]|nr:antitoxin family protein [Chloroflexales bacterium]
MNQTITAVFENGVLRPLTSLDLPEHTAVQVTITIPPPSAVAEVERQRVRTALIAAGLTLPLQESPQTPPLSDEERNMLARRIPAGRPLSELIIEEREGR